MSRGNSDDRVYLVGFAEALATPEVCFSLRATGVRIVSFYRSQTRTRFARLNFVEYHPVTAPEFDFQRSVQDVGALIARIRPLLTAPCDDEALLVLSRIPEHESHCLTPVAACDFAIDKWSQFEAAAASGFSVMPSKLVTGEKDVAEFPFRPAFLKPRNALDLSARVLEKGRSFIIDGTDLPEQAKKAIAGRPYVVQEYKAGIGEGYFGIARDGKVLASFGHQRVRMMNPAGSGASACISREPGADETRAVQALVDRARWQGPFMVELLRDASGRKWFMEFNGRFWGSLALARRCGLDVPRLAFESALGASVVVPSKTGTGFARHLGRDLIHLLFVLRGPGPGPRPHMWPRRWRTIAEIVAPHALKSFYNYDPTQRSFFVKDAVITVLNALGRKGS
jgi:hypothetical protein